MRKMGKIMVGLAAFLIMSGGMLAIAGWVMGADTSYTFERNGYTYYASPFGMTWSGRDDGWVGSWSESHTSDSATGMDPFTAIEVDVSLGDVYVQESDSYGVSLQWENQRNKLYYEVKDGTLRVWGDSGVNIGVGNYDSTTYIYIPYNAPFERVTVTSAMGDVSLNDFTTKSLTVESSLGAVDIGNVTATTADLHLSLGDLNANDFIVGGKATVTNNMGAIDLDGTFHGLDVNCDMGEASIYTTLPKSEYTYNLETSMGSIVLDGDQVKGNSAKGGSGTNSLQVHNSMGSVRVDFE